MMSTVVGRAGSEARYFLATLIPVAAFTATTSDHVAALVAAPLVLFVALYVARTSGSAAAQLTLAGGELVAHYVLRSAERIPVARIAAVEVVRSSWRSRRFAPLTTITVFRRDEPGVIEIHVEDPDAADTFLVELAASAMRAGVADVTPFALPRRHYVHDLLPIVPALAILLLFPFPVSWAGAALACATFLADAALGWRRAETMAKRIAARVPVEGLAGWTSLLGKR